MAITGLADLGDTIPTIIGEATYTLQFKAVMRGLCWNYPADKGSSTNIPYFSEIVAAQLTEKVDMVNSESIVDTNVQITPVEVGLKTILTDDAIEDDKEEMKRVAGRLMGDAYEKKRDQDLLGQLDDAATSLAGSATTLTMGHIAAARATLAGNTGAGGPAPTPYVCVLHPFQELDIVDVVTPLLPAAGTTQSVGSALFDDVIRNYSIGRLFGMPIVIDGNQAPDSGDDVKYGVFAAGRGGGIIYVSKREPQVVPTIDASLRGVELVYVGRYGVGEYHAGWVTELYSDAAAPA